jgi:uncharacterized repeat protein (TIGR01451 family)
MATGAGSAYAALLGVQPGYPDVTFDSLSNPNTYGTSFDPSTGIFNVTALPVTYVWASRKLVTIGGPQSLSIKAHLDASGNLIAGQPGDGLVITGSITPNGVYTGPAYSGTLLTGNITGFGFFNGGTTDSYDFRFTPTGGALFDIFKGGDIGINVSSENSTFNGSFAVAFSGYTKGTVGTITGPHFDLTETCSDSQGQVPIQFSATITNTGSESLKNISCTGTPDSPLTGVPTDLATGASATITGSYLPSATPSTGSLNCSATGSGSQVTITKESSATCNTLVTPALVVAETCTDPSAPGVPYLFSGIINNTGNETLTGISCTDSLGYTQIVADIPAGSSGSFSFSHASLSSPVSDLVTCSAKGAFSKAAVSASSGSATCSINTKPALQLVENCSNAPAPGQAINLTATLTNSGNETLTGVSCSDSTGAPVAGVPTTLPAGASANLSASYVPTGSNSTDTITCKASGSIDLTQVTTSASATCGILTSPGLSLVESCTSASAPGQPISLTATLTNSGNEALSGLSCTDSNGALVSGVPATLAAGGTAALSASYVPVASNSADTITCKASGAINSEPVSSSANATCGILTKPALSLSESCTGAPAPGQPITLAAILTNSGNEALTGLSCTDSTGATVAGVPATLAAGGTAALSASYVPTGSNSTDTLTCKASGAINAAPVSANANATCSITTQPALSLTESCTNASAPGQPIALTATLTNSGNESLTGISCSDSTGATVLGVPATLAAGATAALTGSYVPTGSNSADTITCKASGSINAAAVSTVATATCGILTNPALSLVENCTNASAPGQPINFTATLTNSGNEALTGISCTDSTGATVSGVPASLAANVSAALTGSYTPTTSNSTDTITCKASGSINSALVSVKSSATCNIVTKPAFFVIESCNNASAPGLPINLTVFLTNSGNEALTGISCTDSTGAAINGAPAILAVGGAATLTGSYIPTTSSSTDTVTCKASGVINAAPVSAGASSTCALLSKPGFTIVESCTNAAGSGLPIKLSATITNTGNETLTAFSCSDSKGATLAGVPVSLGAGLTASLTGSYVPTGSNSTDTISCSAKGGIDGVTVSATSSSTCDIVTAACIQIKKQVSTNCSVTGAKDKHCKTDEQKTDYCKKSDCDSSYCGSTTQTKATYCQEVTQKQAHCGSSETKPTYCAKTGCDQSYCGRNELGKDDWCKIPAVPVCVPVWQDADTQDTAATMETASGFGGDSGDTLLSKLSNGTYSDHSSSWLKNLRHVTSNSSGENGDAHDADGNDGWYKSESDNKCNGSEYYQGNVRQQNLSYRFVVSNCGTSDLTNLVINDPKIAVTNFAAGSLKAGSSLTLTSAQIPQLAQPKFYCNSSFVNTVTVSAVDSLNRSVSDSDDAWVLCNTKTCAFTLGYWKNHASSWPVATLKLGSVSYTKSQLLSIFATPPAGNGLISLADQLIAAKLNVANGTIVPASINQAIASADALIGALVVPPVGSGTLPPAGCSALVQTLDSYNSGTLAGGPTHCGDAPPPTQQCTGSIGDYAWLDLNKNGVPAYGELGLAGIKITLSNGKSTTTDSAGHYLFTGLCAGTYQVKATPPCTFISTTSSSVSTTLTTDSSANLGIDFGFAKPATACSGKIGDYVWKDINQSGTQNSTETGLAGVQITLSNGSSAVTDVAGHYQFTGLCAGDYLVTVATPTGYTASAVAQGSDTAKDSKRSPAKVTLATNSSSVQNIDFGFYKTTAPSCTGVIGNYIWNDLNKNGLQDCTEKGISGVAVTLSNGQSTLSDADGHYQFSGLCAGTYTVSVATPDGFTPSPVLQGTSRAADSNANAASVTLSDNGASELSIDFGFWKLPTPTPSQSKGCSLGYWKNHTANWPSASHTVDNFDTVFGANAFSPDINLLQALNTTGGGLSNLARQAAAALLNAEDSRITGYPMSASEIKAAVLHAILTGNYDCLASKLDSYNNLGCPLN